MKRRARNRKLEGSNLLFCKDIKLKMVADGKRKKIKFYYVRKRIT